MIFPLLSFLSAQQRSVCCLINEDDDDDDELLQFNHFEFGGRLPSWILPEVDFNHSVAFGTRCKTS